MTRETKTLEFAYVLHRRAWSETSVIVSFFTPTDGLVDCVAKGARRPKSSLRGALHPFTLLQISYKGSPASLKTLTDAQISDRGKVFTGITLLSALYLNELLVKLLPTADMRMGTMFDCYQNTLHRLETEPDTRWALRDFEIILLEEMGFGLDFMFDSTNITIHPQALYSFNIEDGIVKIAHYAGDNPKEGIPGEVMLALGQRKLELKHLGPAKRLLQTALHYHLGYSTSFAHRTLSKLMQDTI